MSKLIGVAITSHNQKDQLERLLSHLDFSVMFVAVVLDNCNDNSFTELRKIFPRCHFIETNRDYFWGGGINLAFESCLANSCTHIVSVNADVKIEAQVIVSLVKLSIDNDDAVVGAIVIDDSDKSTVIWSGSTFGRIFKNIPLITSKYCRKGIFNAEDKELTPVDEVHGRGVVFPSIVFKRFGLIDSENFPHYGGDTDFSLRLKRYGQKMFVARWLPAYLLVDNSKLSSKPKSRLLNIVRYLITIRHGNALRTWYIILKRNSNSFIEFTISYVFVISINIYRKLLQ